MIEELASLYLEEGKPKEAYKLLGDLDVVTLSSDGVMTLFEAAADINANYPYEEALDHLDLQSPEHVERFAKALESLEENNTVSILKCLADISIENLSPIVRSISQDYFRYTQNILEFTSFIELWEAPGTVLFALPPTCLREAGCTYASAETIQNGKVCSRFLSISLAAFCSTLITRLVGVYPLARQRENGDFEYLKEQISMAVLDELAVAYSEGGRAYFLFNGRLIQHYKDDYLYTFSTDEELKIPEGSEVYLESDSTKVDASLLGIEGFTVWLTLKQPISLEAEWAISSNPYFLLETLHKHVKEASWSPVSADLFFGDPGRTGNPQRYTVDTLVAGLEDEPVVLVWGPPGTGKTQFVARYAHKLIDQGEKVLVMSVSNIAVDNATTRIHRLSDPASSPRIVRYGYPRDEELINDDTLVAHLIARSRHPDLVEERNFLADQRRRLMAEPQRFTRERFKSELDRLTGEIKTIDDLLSEEEVQIARSANVLLTTLAKGTLADFIVPAYLDLSTDTYDTVILDEASMINLAYMLWSSTLPKKRLVIVGDFRQLPPISRCQSETGKKYMETDIFDFLDIPEIVDSGQWEPRLHILCEQHRMNPSISCLVNGPVYKGLLRDGSGAETRKEGKYDPYRDYPALVVDTSEFQPFCLKDPSQRTSSRLNIHHALLDILIAEMTSSDSVGVITPYVLQGRITNRLVAEQGFNDSIACSTVHRFQGSERRVVILDTVDSSGVARAGTLIKGGHGTSAMRLLNVAITRAMEKLIIVADKKWLAQRLDKANVLANAFGVLPAVDAIDLLDEMPQPAFGQILHGDEFLKDALMSICSAKKSVRVFADGTRWIPFIVEGIYALRQIYSRARDSFGSSNEVNLEVIVHPKTNPKVIDPEALAEKLRQLPFESSIKRSSLGRVNAVIVDQSKMYLDLSSPKRTTERDQARGLRINLPNTVNLISSLLTVGAGKSVGKLASFLEETKCPECGSNMEVRKGKYGYFLGCIMYPRCKGMMPIQVQRVQDYLDYMRKQGEGLDCPRCKSPIEARKGKYGLFLSCSLYPQCKYSEKIDVIL
ncbi:MAG TPA: AAA domain-containing protein [Bacillota bacterium]|nr:AAA domain-containing protein [Bacillota bacterium]HPZ78733.1 AAA domain-containing protein [Bacillota bacterium]HQD74805.1 AAA domain-containing protein [Bacillota bacterium]